MTHENMKMTSAGQSSIATSREKQIMHHCRENVLTAMKKNFWGFSLWRSTEIQSMERIPPQLKLKACARGDALLNARLKHLRERWGGGRGAERGKGGVMSRWVKITWQGRADHTNQLPKIWGILFLVTEGAPGRSFLNHATEKGQKHTHQTDTHTHWESWSDPNLNSLDERWHCLNNPHFLQMCAHQMRRGCTLKPELHPCPYAFLTFESSEGVNIWLGRICPPDTTEE